MLPEEFRDMLIRQSRHTPHVQVAETSWQFAATHYIDKNHAKTLVDKVLADFNYYYRRVFHHAFPVGVLEIANMQTSFCPDDSSQFDSMRHVYDLQVKLPGEDTYSSYIYCAKRRVIIPPAEADNLADAIVECGGDYVAAFADYLQRRRQHCFVIEADASEPRPRPRPRPRQRRSSRRRRQHRDNLDGATLFAQRKMKDSSNRAVTQVSDAQEPEIGCLSRIWRSLGY